MNLGDKIRNLRKNENMSQEVLAKYLNINRNYLSRIETGKTEPNSSVLINLSNTFKISIDSLLEINKNNVSINDKIKYIKENLHYLSNEDLDFIIKMISIMKKEFIKKKF